MTNNRLFSMRCFLIVFSTILISACGSKPVPKTHYYLLDLAPLGLNEGYRDQLIEVTQIALPRYLKSNQLVMLASDNRLVPASYHKWADEFGPSVRRALLAYLEAASEKTSFTKACDQCEKLRLTIEHFYPSVDGRLFFSGNYLVDGLNGVSLRKRFAFEEPLENAGYAQAVKQMNGLIKRLAREIAAQLQVD